MTEPKNTPTIPEATKNESDFVIPLQPPSPFFIFMMKLKKEDKEPLPDDITGSFSRLTLEKAPYVKMAKVKKAQFDRYMKTKAEYEAALKHQMMLKEDYEIAFKKFTEKQ